MIDTLDINIETVERSRISDVDFDNIKFGKICSDHMFIADYKDGSWNNFRISPFGNLRISPANLALHYGQSVFEGLKAYKSEEGDVLIFRPYDNAQRLNISAQRMCMPPFPEDIFIQAITSLLELDKQWIPSNPDCALYIRPFMFASDEYIGIKPSDTYKFLVITSPVGPYYPEPIKVYVETKFTRSVQGGVGFAKAAGNYGAALYPAKLAQDKGYRQLIWTDAVEHKYIEESGTMNIMFVFGDTLVTPPVSDTILDGITRRSVLQLAKDLGVKVEERPVSIDEMIDGYEKGILKEIFGVGTAATIAPITVVGYNDQDYVLPDVTTAEVSQKIAKTLEGIKTGKIGDVHNWVYKL